MGNTIAKVVVFGILDLAGEAQKLDIMRILLYLRHRFDRSIIH